MPVSSTAAPRRRHEMLGGVGTYVVADGIGVPAGVAQQALQWPGPGGPACSAGRRQFFRSALDSSPSRQARAETRASTRLNRPAIRAIAWSNIACQWSGSTLWPAATALIFVCPHTNR